MRAPLDGRRERHGRALVRPRALPLRLEPALALRLPARGAARGHVRVAPAARPPRDLGLRRHHDARVDAVVPRRRARAPPRASWPRTGSTCREADRPCSCRRPARPGPRRSSARCARTASASCAWSARTCPSGRSGATSATRSTSCRPARIPGSRTPCSTSAGRERVDVVLPAVVVRPRGARRASRPVRGRGRARDRVVAGHDPPLERQGRDVRAPEAARAPRARTSAGSTARARSRRQRPSSATRSGRSASSRSSRRARAASAILDPTVDRAHQLLHERPGQRRDAARGGRRAASGRGRAGSARDGARDGRRAHDRRDRRRRARPARPPEDARGDAGRPRDVLRHARAIRS